MATGAEFSLFEIEASAVVCSRPDSVCVSVHLSTLLGFLADEGGRTGADRFFAAVALDCRPEVADAGRAVPLFAARGDTSSSTPLTSLSAPGSMTAHFSVRCTVGSFASVGFFTVGLRCATRFLAGFGVGVEASLFFSPGAELFCAELFFPESAFFTGVGFGRSGNSSCDEGCPRSPSRRFGKGSSRFGGSKSKDLSVSSNGSGCGVAQWRRPTD